MRTTLLRLLAGIFSLGAIVSLTMLSSGRDAQAATTTVPVGDFFFCSNSFENGVCDTTINVGDTVTWDFSGAFNSHTSTNCGSDCDNPTTSPLWDSGTVSGGTFSFTFDSAGTYLYMCTIHPLQMRGRIIVQAAAGPSPTTAAGGATTPSPAAGATPTGSSNLPTTGQGPTKDESSSPMWPIAALGGIGLLLGAAGAVAYGRSKR